MNFNMISAFSTGEASETKLDKENPVFQSSSCDKESIRKSYPMDCKFRGRCLFFGNGLFDVKRKRDFINEDSLLIKKTFTNLGFKTKSYIDLEYQNIKHTLDKLTRQDFTNDDCICIFISTHGESDGLIWAKDVCYPFIKTFEDRIASIKSLINKPKIFFIQACRGLQIDKGICSSEVTSSEDEVDGNQILTKVSIKADIFKAYSAPPGFVSWQASLFIREVCKSFNKYGKTADLETIVKIASREVRKFENKSKYSARNGANQIPYIEHTLDKMVYFRDKESPSTCF
ncbi:hypothetical protein TSAR_003350 [Trichomalopsis sarcophagae]|uniref:Caspase family p20 domain-containing protein n=1 Tax=Trichomalopsis sarcophagae TaxID=543379 RepID=A0A232FD62_9HYME|nr:hypothetical protein TSAR_003350 [Trichomalopsis sarcophagae]